MTISYKIYDWPSVSPTRQLFYSGGAAIEGGFTAGGARMLMPEPGGRGVLQLEFDYQSNSSPNPLVSWLCTMIGNGNIFRIPIRNSPQLVNLNDQSLQSLDKPWSNEQNWSNDQPWTYSPVILTNQSSLPGATVIVVDFGIIPTLLRHGHLIGHLDVTYMVEDISYSGTVATITVNPPLRNPVAQGDFILFRPKMLAVARNPENFRGLYENTQLIKLGSVEFMEAVI